MSLNIPTPGNFDPQLLAAITKQIQRQEKLLCPNPYLRYLKNVWEAICNRKNVMIIEVTRMPHEAAKYMDDLIEEMREADGEIKQTLQKIRNEVSDDNLSTFKRAFSQGNNGTSERA